MEEYKTQYEKEIININITKNLLYPIERNKKEVISNVLTVLKNQLQEIKTELILTMGKLNNIVEKVNSIVEC